MKLSLEVTTQRVSYERYARAYDSEAFNVLLLRAHKLKSRTLLEARMLPDGTQYKRVRIVPEVRVPRALQSLVTGVEHAIWYDEVTIYDDAARTASLHIESPAGERVRATGIARCSEEDGGVRLCFEGEVHIKLAGMGPLIERFIVAEVKNRYVEVHALLQRFLDADPVS